jgi:hypothetical protein
MPKSDFFTILIGLVAAVAGYLIVDQSAATELTNWLRQEIRKELPDGKAVGHPNYTPAVTSRGS